MAMGWFPEVTLPWLSLSVWGFVEGTPFFPEAGAERVEHWTHDHSISRGRVHPAPVMVNPRSRSDTGSLGTVSARGPRNSSPGSWTWF